MEPARITDARLLAVQQELADREPIFHRAQHGTTRPAFEAMTDPEFWEVGASGRHYSRAYVLATLEQRHAAPSEDAWETQDFFCQEIGPDNYLLTYTLLHAARVTRRATLWRRTADGWKIVYHQGTVVESA